MTREAEDPDVVERTVVFFDICSSSNMLEDLMLSNNQRVMRNLLIAVKNFLKSEAAEQGFEVHKFIGDGWVLLFPGQTSGESLITFLDKLCKYFHHQLAKRVLPQLQGQPRPLGLTFGVDRGQLIRIRMMGRQEYMGRPLNIASRLQGAIKEKDESPGYKVLFSKPSFQALKFPTGFRKFKEVERTLRNIQGGEKYSCVKMKLKLTA
ncbi:MAG TPA: hypothetical protein VEJ38_03405 [Candidatus Acidoferrales bacterium]|nr:hypothetical protein [Candidatus Acidoferrales bacterium]